MGDITEWVTAYGVPVTRLRTRTLVFPEATEEKIRGFYRGFLEETKMRKDSTIQVLYDFPEEESPADYELGMTFIASKRIGESQNVTNQRRNQYLDEFTDWLFENDIGVTERLPVRLSDDTQWKIKQSIVDTA